LFVDKATIGSTPEEDYPSSDHETEKSDADSTQGEGNADKDNKKIEYNLEFEDVKPRDYDDWLDSDWYMLIVFEYASKMNHRATFINQITNGAHVWDIVTPSAEAFAITVLVNYFKVWEKHQHTMRKNLQMSNRRWYQDADDNNEQHIKIDKKHKEGMWTPLEGGMAACIDGWKLSGVKFFDNLRDYLAEQ